MLLTVTVSGRFLWFGGLIVVLCSLFVTSASQGQDAPADRAVEGVNFAAIDQATVRVFAVQDVVQETVQGRFQQRVLGIPDAGHGTGVVVDPRGVVITAKHVVEGARHLAVRLPGGGPVLPTQVVYSDPQLDFAILLVLTSGPLTAITLPEQAGALNVRETVDAIGYPFDAGRSQPQSSRGIISGVLDDGHLQLDMSLNPGNSGGPLLASDERLVGIVVARADPTRGAQGIGIAVPIAPVRAAFDQVRTRGVLSQAYRALQANRENANRAAEAVDAIVRLGGADLLREAADFVDNAEASERIDSLRAMAERAQDADLLALLSAYFWDAAQVMVERDGGVATPAQMTPGPAQQLADQLWRLAFTTARRARDADATVVQRSPFVAFLVGATPSAPQHWQQSGQWQQPQGPQAQAPRAGWRGRGGENQRQGWRPWLLAGFNLFGGREFPEFGMGARFAALFPLGSGGRSTGFKFRFLLGPSVDVGRAAGETVFFVGTDLGFGIRVGGKVGFSFFALWSQGYQRSVTDCYDAWDCYGANTYVPAAGHFGASIRIATVHVGFSFRVLGSDVFEYRDLGVTWSFSIPQVSWTF